MSSPRNSLFNVEPATEGKGKMNSQGDATKVPG